MAADRRARHGHDIVGSLRGGSSGSAPPPVTYGASATAGTGGNVTPARATVNPGGTATFPVTPNSGYVISSVTSSGGGLTGNTYTTGMVNEDCTVTASFSAAFTWIGDSYTSDAGGDYGSPGIAAASNVPGAGTLRSRGRMPPASCGCSADTVWGLRSSMTCGSTRPRAVGGPGSAARALPMQAPTTAPGGHRRSDQRAWGPWGSSRTWTDASGNLWMFGGYGYDSTGTRGWLNALWEFNPATGMWTWVGGSERKRCLWHERRRRCDEYAGSPRSRFRSCRWPACGGRQCRAVWRIRLRFHGRARFAERRVEVFAGDGHLDLGRRARYRERERGIRNSRCRRRREYAGRAPSRGLLGR